MLAWMNADAVARTLETGPRDLLEPLASGVLGQGRNARVMCRSWWSCASIADRDCLLVLVRQTGPPRLSHEPAGVCFLHGRAGTDGKSKLMSPG